MATKTEKKTPVLFLDRDGTINVDIGPEYVSREDQLKLIPGAGKAILKARAAGFKIAIVTNQAGVAKGKTPREALPVVHRHLETLVATEAGVADFRFDDIRVCIHHPDDKCACRKPQPQNLRDAIEALRADVARSFFVGDKDGDLKVAARVGMRSILVLTGHGPKTAEECENCQEMRPVDKVPTLVEAVELAIRLRDTEA